MDSYIKPAISSPASWTHARIEQVSPNPIPMIPMTELLKKAFAEASRLPESDQDWLAALMLDRLRSEQRWNDLFERSQDMLEKMADEAIAEHSAGKTLPLDPDKL